MTFRKTFFEVLGVTLEYASFPSKSVSEWHAMMHIEPRGDTFQGQLERLYEAEARVLMLPEFAGARYVLKRYFLSDSANQQPLMRQEKDVAISIIQQQPLDGSKIASWLYLQRGTDIRHEEGATVCCHGGYKHIWKMGMVEPEGDSAAQTKRILQEYENTLQKFGATLSENCIRTWFFVRDVDTQYMGMVRARRENFVEQGLTEQTHYIASTGIGGVPGNTRGLIQFGAYALLGLVPEQQHYLYAPSHLNPTYEYGVTFERGTVVEYGDRSHVFISGTASIDNRGKVLFEGDIVKQTQRVWENVETLLAEADTTYADVMQMVVYLRDVADYAIVQKMFAERFPNIPMVITLAPVCRPAWLIEMECIAVKEQNNPAFKPF